MTAGYSGTPLTKKLGVNKGMTLVVINVPDDYMDLLIPLPAEVTITGGPIADPDIVHLFTNSRDELFRTLAECRNLIKQDGSIWVSWYKKAAKLPTEIPEDTVREAVLC